MPDQWLAVAAQYGPLGLVLAWVLWRSEPRLERIERALDRLSRAQLLTLIARPDVDEPVRQQARELLKELPPPRNGNGYGEN